MRKNLTALQIYCLMVMVEQSGVDARTLFKLIPERFGHHTSSSNISACLTELAFHGGATVGLGVTKRRKWATKVYSITPAGQAKLAHALHGLGIHSVRGTLTQAVVAPQMSNGLVYLDHPNQVGLAP